MTAWSPESRARAAQRRAERQADRDAEIAKLYRSGRRQKSIALEFNLSPATIRRIISAQGAQRQQSELPGRQPRRNERVVAEYRAGYSQREIAAMHGITQKAVNDILRRMGVPKMTKEERLARAAVGRPRLVIPEDQRAHYEKLRRYFGAERAREELNVRCVPRHVLLRNAA